MCMREILRKGGGLCVCVCGGGGGGCSTCTHVCMQQIYLLVPFMLYALNFDNMYL